MHFRKQGWGSRGTCNLPQKRRWLQNIHARDYLNLLLGETEDSHVLSRCQRCLIVTLKLLEN